MFYLDIGEKAVLTGLLENNVILGGENNGHYMLLNKITSCDGIFIAAQILSIYETNDTLKTPFEPYYQVEKAIPVKNKNDVMKNTTLLETIELCETLLMENGRILVRASGTEEVIRILVESEDKILATKIVCTLIEAVKSLSNI